jgi:hypothetical protein
MTGGDRPRSLDRLRAALARRRHGPYPALERIERDLAGLAREVGALQGRVEGLDGRMEALDGRLGTLERYTEATREDLRRSLMALAAKEVENRRRLGDVREGEGFDRPWSDAAPLVSVTIATVGRPELTSRALPSVLAQSHDELEVIVVGDGAAPEIEKEVAALGDPRVRYIDLGPRVPWTDDATKRWLVGSTRPRNAGVALARGGWVVEFDDDDAMRPQCIATLLELARETRAEAVYGQVRAHFKDGSHVEFCEFPPRIGHFCWAAGMYHAGLRFFGRELLAADLGLPGDWWLAERMLRAGVRFAMSEEVLCDTHPSYRAERAAGQGRFPWAGPSGLPWADPPSG